MASEERQKQSGLRQWGFALWGFCCLWNLAGSWLTYWWILYGITDTRFTLAFVGILVPTVVGWLTWVQGVTAVPVHRLLRVWPNLHHWQRAFVIGWSGLASAWLLLVLQFLTAMSSQPRLGLRY